MNLEFVINLFSKIILFINDKNLITIEVNSKIFKDFLVTGGL